jgi:ABC-type lipoprotein release transport system permease subunit
MPFEWFVALRFLREGRMQTVLILLGVSVGVGVIIFLSALITGLQVSLIDKTLGSQAHIVVRPPEEMPRVLVDGRVAGTDAGLAGQPASADERGGRSGSGDGQGDAITVRIEKPAQRMRSINQDRKSTRLNSSHSTSSRMPSSA